MEFRLENWFCKLSCFYCVSWNLANTFHNRVMSATLIPKEDNHFHSWDEWRPRHIKSRSVCNPLLLLNSLLIFTSLLAGDGIVGIHCHIANTWYSVVFKTICLLLLLFYLLLVLLLFYGIGIEPMHMLGKHTITESYPRSCLTSQLRPNVTSLQTWSASTSCLSLLGLQPWSRRPSCLSNCFLLFWDSVTKSRVALNSLFHWRCLWTLVSQPPFPKPLEW